MQQTSILTYRKHDFTSIRESIYKCISEFKYPITLVGLSELTNYSKAQIGRRLPELLRDGLIKIQGTYKMNRRHYSLYVIANEEERKELILKQFKSDYFDWLKESKKFEILISTDLFFSLKKEIENA